MGAGRAFMGKRASAVAAERADGWGQKGKVAVGAPTGGSGWSREAQVGVRQRELGGVTRNKATVMKKTEASAPILLGAPATGQARVRGQ